MSLPADIVVFDENERIVILVEVKAAPRTSPDWAMEKLRDLLAATPHRQPPLCLIVARDYTYISSHPASPHATPVMKLPTAEIFAEYLRDIGSTADEIAPSALELMVGIWLSDLTGQDARAAAAPWVRQLGLAQASVNGRVDFLTAA